MFLWSNVLILRHIDRKYTPIIKTKYKVDYWVLKRSQSAVSEKRTCILITRTIEQIVMLGYHAIYFAFL